MRLPSRRLPPLVHPAPSIITAGLLIGLLLVAVACVIYAMSPAGRAVAAALVGGVVVWGSDDIKNNKRRLTQLAQGRPHLSICTFARHFDKRAVDTWIIRATYEEVRSALADDVADFPLCATDSLVNDLGIDPALIDDIASDIAQRTGRSFADPGANPYFGAVENMEELVMFVDALPRI